MGDFELVAAIVSSALAAGALVAVWTDLRRRRSEAALRDELTAAQLALESAADELRSRAVLVNDLSERDLSGQNLAQLDLSHTNGSRSDFSQAVLRGARLQHADLTEIAARDADLVGADLRSARLVKADLSDAELARANLQEVLMDHARLVGANLSGADLRDASIRGASFSRAILRGADLRGADLTDAADLETADLLDALFDSSTLWPSGFSPPQPRSFDAQTRSLIALPMYLALDLSASMTGARAKAIENAMESLAVELAGDPVLRDRLRITVVGFSDRAEVLSGGVEVSRIELPRLRPRGSTHYRPAFSLVQKQIDSDIRRLRQQGITTYRPVVLFITDGQPVDRDWDVALDRLKKSPTRPWVIAIGLAPGLGRLLAKIGDLAFEVAPETQMAEAVMELMGDLTQAVTASVAASEGRASAYEPWRPRSSRRYVLVDDQGQNLFNRLVGMLPDYGLKSLTAEIEYAGYDPLRQRLVVNLPHGKRGLLIGHEGGTILPIQDALGVRLAFSDVLLSEEGSLLFGRAQDTLSELGLAGIAGAMQYAGYDKVGNRLTIRLPRSLRERFFAKGPELSSLREMLGVQVVLEDADDLAAGP